MTELSNSILTIIRGTAQLSKPRKKFLSHILELFLSINQRVNFLQLARHSNKYVESSFRLHFEEYFDFSDFNKELIMQHGSGHYVLSFDRSSEPPYLHSQKWQGYC
jgi:predicted nucleic acid-binding protein